MPGSLPSRSLAEKVLSALFASSFGYWAISVVFGLAESGSLARFATTLASCPLLGGAVPPPQPVPLWAYGIVLPAARANIIELTLLL